LLLLCFRLFETSPAFGLPPVPVDTVRLNPSVQQALSRLQDQWLLWNSSFLQGDFEQMDAAQEDLVRTTAELGFERLPDLAAVAMQRAVEAARSGSVERSERALNSASRFDSSNAAWHFASSRVQAENGRPLRALGAALVGFGNLLGQPEVRPVIWRNLLVWASAVLQATGVLFVALLMAIKGSALLRDIRVATGTFLPALVAGGLGIALLVFPAFLPGGWLWVTLLWTILLWGYCTLSERTVIALTVICVVILPSAVLLAHSRLEPEQSESMSLVRDIEQRSLRGTFFDELAVLSRTLPRSTAVRHMTADIHQRLGQDDVARPLYAAVVQAEPRNGAALNNLGLFHFVRGDLTPAIAFLQQAADERASAAAAHYNLAASYDELLEFRSATSAREAGRRADPDRFSSWGNSNRPFVGVWGGLERGDEIRGELRQNEGIEAISWQRLLKPSVVALFVILLGPVVRWLRAGRIGMRRDAAIGRELWIERAARRIVPGAVAADSGDGWRAFLELLVPVGLILAAMASRLELLPLPSAQQPVYGVVQIFAVLALIVYLTVSWWRRA
jgi:tetratricopeptide (TPR) repeat protein